ncbi:MAG: hypothetical protein U0U66_11380 [Cytophagaceae bacterium]
MKKIQSIKLSVYILLLSVLISSCKKDKDNVATPPAPEEQELITTIIVSFKKTPTATDSLTFAWRDADGEGGAAPVIDPIAITTEYTYLSVHVLNESNPNDVEDISEEIQEKGNEHQLFYTTGTDYMTMAYIDMDDHGVPIGLKMTLSDLTTVTNSTLQIVLKHQPGIKPVSGQGNASLGASDFDVTFPLTIQ